MVYQCLRSDIFFNELLSSYTGGFHNMYIPNVLDEKYIYINIPETDIVNFTKHFGHHANELKNMNDYPASERGISSLRVKNFIHSTPG